MRKTSFLLAFLLSGLLLSAQSIIPYKVQSLQGFMGFSFEGYGDQMSLDWMKTRTQTNEAFEIDLSGLNENIYTVNVGFNMGGQIILKSRSNNEGPELRLGANLIVWKESLIDYTDDYKTNSDPLNYMYCFVENEIKLNAELVWRASKGRLGAYAGFGADLSKSFDNELYLFESYLYSGSPGFSEFSESDAGGEMQVFDGYNALFTRVYVPFGIGLRLFDHWEVNLEQRLGFGLETVLGKKEFNRYTMGSTQLGLRYYLEAYDGRRPLKEMIEVMRNN